MVFLIDIALSKVLKVFIKVFESNEALSKLQTAPLKLNIIHIPVFFAPNTWKSLAVNVHQASFITLKNS